MGEKKQLEMKMKIKMKSKTQLYLVEYCNAPKAHAFVTLPLQSHLFKHFLVLGKISLTIPISSLKLIPIFGLGFLFGLPFFENIEAYANTGSVSLEDLQEQLDVIIRELNRLLPQLNSFINRFHNFLIETGINVITDAQGGLSIDVPENLNDSLAEQYANRINIFDGLIRNHINQIDNLIQRGSEIEDQIREINSNYLSQLTELKNRLSIAVSSYKHYKP
jgi:predicted PurR-regulated permease PerM